MGRACGTFGGEERCVPGVVGKPEGKRPLARPRVEGRIIWNWTLRSGWVGGVMDRIALARDRLRALVNAVMNLPAPYHKMRGISCMAEELSFSGMTLLHAVSDKHCGEELRVGRPAFDSPTKGFVCNFRVLPLCK